MNLEQRAIIIGTLLGDSYLHFSDAGTTSLCVKQADRYKEYVFWMYKNLKHLFRGQPKQRIDNGQWQIRSTYSTELNDLHHLFYTDGVKIIPSNIKNLLASPLTLAVWFMDDGTLDYRKNNHCDFHICTNCFSKKEAEKLVKVLYSNFGIIASVHYNLCRGKRSPRIYIGAKGRDRFINLISPYILDCFKYKLPQFRRTPQRLDPSGSDSTAVRNMVL